MSFNHLQLLIQKSVRYAWRRRTGRYFPKIIFELFIPTICILLLCLLRWIYTPSSAAQTSSRIHEVRESMYVWNYTSVYRCPPASIPIEVRGNETFNRFKRICRRSQFVLGTSEPSNEYLFLNTSSNTHEISYHCRYHHRHWCEKTNLNQDALHASSFLCSYSNLRESNPLLQGYLAVESLLDRPTRKQQLLVLTWPCSSYYSDAMFELFPRFTLILIFILIDGCILFSFNFLFQELIDEKHQEIIELLRLLSIHPLLNSLAWFLRIFFLQLIINLFLVLILKISFNGSVYLGYVSIGLILPSIFLWTIQVLSRSILVAHVFNHILPASLWSWLMYLISFWLAMTSSIQVPLVLHRIASAWLPFYAIKRMIILFFQINANLGRQKYLIEEIIFNWLCMMIGILVMWILAFYFERIRPGKYGIARSWLWPLDSLRHRRKNVEPTLIETVSTDQTTVRVDNLTKSYGRHADRQIAVNHISFTLENSSICGLIGHNGAGKTTTMEMICGLLSCDCGRIEIHQKNLFENLHELQSCIGYCPQQDMLFSYLTVREQLEFYAKVRAKGKKIDDQQIDQFLIMMEMLNFQEQLCHTLSGGMQRKVSILCAFVGEVDVIILDEPSSSLDPIARRILWSWLRQSKQNRTLLISSHLLDEVEELCDSVIILDSGTIRAQGTILELKEKLNPSGDRIHLDAIPSYIPQEWISDENQHYIQIPDRKKLIPLLERLEDEQIKYSLDNITLDEIFVKLFSSEDASLQEDNVNRSQIDALFTMKTNTHRWSQQVIGVLIRRSQVFVRQARLLPVVILLYLAYALSPLYMPSFAPPSNRISYVISSASELTEKLNFKTFETKFVPPFHSSRDFQQYLSELPTWSADYPRRKQLIGIRVTSSNHFECYIPSPVLSNIISSCLPIFSVFSNRSISPLQLLSNTNRYSSSTSPPTPVVQDNSIFCFSILPPTFHFSIILISLILIICAALIIQDYASGLYSYSLIHGLRSSIHWSITFLSDLTLCLLWLLILTLIARFVHSSTFNGLFFALTSLLFIVDLPFIYLTGKLFRSPVIGATVILFALQLAHLLNTFKVFFEILRVNSVLSKLIPVLRWVLLLVFPNVNVFILIEAVLRKSLCPWGDFISEQKAFSEEHYPHKILIHTCIFLIQFILYFILLVMIDTSKLPCFEGGMKGEVNPQEDSDVAEERHRIESMTDGDRQHEALIIDNLSKYYRRSGVLALNRLTFAVPHGECFGLLGFNGSGKTTTYRMLVGELKQSAGHMYKNKQSLIGYCPQNDISFSALTVLQSIDYICRLHGLPPTSLNQLILTQFQLEKYRHYLVSNLSGGTRRRLHLALCLIGSPTLLLLDEPTAKVDPLLRRHIRLILEHRPIDTSIIFASHSMLECEQLCDRLTILVRGNAQCLGSPDHLKNKYGKNYRIRLTLRQSDVDIPSLTHIDNSNEYWYTQGSLAELFTTLEHLVEQNIIAPNYTVQLTSLEHIFLTLQHLPDIKS